MIPSEVTDFLLSGKKGSVEQVSEAIKCLKDNEEAQELARLLVADLPYRKRRINAGWWWYIALYRIKVFGTSSEHGVQHYDLSRLSRPRVLQESKWGGYIRTNQRYGIIMVPKKLEDLLIMIEELWVPETFPQCESPPLLIPVANRLKRQRKANDHT